MQTIDEAKEHSAECRRGIAAAVLSVVIFLAAFAGVAGETADRRMSEFAGIDVSAAQTNQATRLDLPKALGPFKKGTAFADEKGRIHQIRCVAEYPKDVKPKVIVKEIEELLPLIERQFACKCVGSKGDRSTVCRWRFALDESPRREIQAYVVESKSQGCSNGCYMAGLTLFR